VYEGCCNDDIKVVESLLTTRGIDVNRQDKEGDTSLHLVSSNRYTEFVTLLLAAKEIDVKRPNSIVRILFDE
jgi:ankyrin repeat protein